MKKALKIIKWTIASLLLCAYMVIFAFVLAFDEIERIVDPYVVIGKTATEICEIYGEFDLEEYAHGEVAGITTGKYLVLKHMFFGNDVSGEEFLVIYFDSEGVATDCKIQFEWYG